MHYHNSSSMEGSSRSPFDLAEFARKVFLWSTDSSEKSQATTSLVNMIRRVPKPRSVMHACHSSTDASLFERAELCRGGSLYLFVSH